MKMTERQYTGLQKVYTKGTLSGMIKINTELSHIRKLKELRKLRS
mgnify:CR=1 FL=1